MNKNSCETRRPLLAALVLVGLGLTGAQSARAVLIGGVDVYTARATTTAKITGGGYVTPFTAPNDVALASNTSLDWTEGSSLGTYFPRPYFQPGYSSSTPVFGDAGSAVTLGQDPGYPEPDPIQNEREMIQLTWGSGNGLTNGAGDDLAIFEQATSEAFAVRVHQVMNGSGWSAWYYVPHEHTLGENGYDAAYDTTPTLIDLTADLGLATGVVINAIEITNLIATDTVATQLDSGAFGLGEVTFGGGGGYAPGRFSGSQQAWAGFGDGKYDPDIQYVVGMHDLTTGVSGSIADLATGAGFSFPDRPAPLTPAYDGEVSTTGVAPLLLLGLVVLAGGRRHVPARLDPA